MASSSPALSRFMNIEAGQYHVVFYDLFYDVSRQQYSLSYDFWRVHISGKSYTGINVVNVINTLSEELLLTF